MSVSLLSVEGNKVKLTVEITLGGGMLDSEEGIQEALNAAGRVATEQALKRFDTDGSAIVREGGELDEQRSRAESVSNALW